MYIFLRALLQTYYYLYNTPSLPGYCIYNNGDTGDQLTVVNVY